MTMIFLFKFVKMTRTTRYPQSGPFGHHLFSVRRTYVLKITIVRLKKHYFWQAMESMLGPGPGSAFRDPAVSCIWPLPHKCPADPARAAWLPSDGEKKLAKFFWHPHLTVIEAGPNCMQTHILALGRYL